MADPGNHLRKLVSRYTNLYLKKRINRYFGNELMDNLFAETGSLIVIAGKRKLIR